MVTGNNPGAVLLSPYHRMKFAVAYGRGKLLREDKSTTYHSDLLNDPDVSNGKCLGNSSEGDDGCLDCG